MENGEADARQDATAQYLAEIFNARVTVKLNSGIVYKGQYFRFEPSRAETDQLAFRYLAICRRLYERGLGGVQGIR